MSLYNTKTSPLATTHLALPLAIQPTPPPPRPTSDPGRHCKSQPSAPAVSSSGPPKSVPVTPSWYQPSLWVASTTVATAAPVAPAAQASVASVPPLFPSMASGAIPNAAVTTAPTAAAPSPAATNTGMPWGTLGSTAAANPFLGPMGLAVGTGAPMATPAPTPSAMGTATHYAGVYSAPHHQQQHQQQQQAPASHAPMFFVNTTGGPAAQLPIPSQVIPQVAHATQTTSRWYVTYEIWSLVTYTLFLCEYPTSATLLSDP